MVPLLDSGCTLAAPRGLWELRGGPTWTTLRCTSRWCVPPTTRISQGHLPLTSLVWPSLGLGSPQFLHYQSLPSMLSGLIGTFADPDTVFRWSLYLLC